MVHTYKVRRLKMMLCAARQKRGISMAIRSLFLVFASCHEFSPCIIFKSSLWLLFGSRTGRHLHKNKTFSTNLTSPPLLMHSCPKRRMMTFSPICPATNKYLRLTTSLRQFRAARFLTTPNSSATAIPPTTAVTAMTTFSHWAEFEPGAAAAANFAIQINLPSSLPWLNSNRLQISAQKKICPSISVQQKVFRMFLIYLSASFLRRACDRSMLSITSCQSGC